jgi:hypothetical protein
MALKADPHFSIGLCSRRLPEILVIGVVNIEL